MIGRGQVQVRLYTSVEYFDCSLHTSVGYFDCSFVIVKCSKSSLFMTGSADGCSGVG